MIRNTLYFGDNLDILRRYLKDETVDLIYLDPPFNSNASYNVLFKEEDGSQAASQIQAFDDTWHFDRAAAEQFDDTVRAGGPVSDALIAFRQLLGTNPMLAYLTTMAPRLVELRRVLKPTGSLYLHCDPTASHYLKILLDAVFGPMNFKNEICWTRTVPKSDFRQGATNWPRVHDCLLYYVKRDTRDVTFSQQFGAYTPEYIASSYPFVEPETGRRYGGHSLTAPGAGSRGHPHYEFLGVTRYWRYNQEKMEALLKDGRILQSKPGTVPRYKRYLDEVEGVPFGDMWTDVHMLQGASKERTGYATQKPLALLERILLASSNEGDVVLDPFCGCGTTVCAAEKLGRKWIGIDVTYLALTLMKQRLGDAPDYEVVGEPTSVADAEALALQNRHQFQLWALGLVKARPIEVKKGADKGVDGRIPFNQGAIKGKEQYTHAVIQVKSGHVTSACIRDLVGTVGRENAALGVLITLQPPTKDMLNEAASAGFYVLPYDETKKYPKIQILTIKDLVEDKKQIDCAPLHYTSVSYAQGPKVERESKEATLGFEEAEE